MIFVDSGVWIDFYNDVESASVGRLGDALATELVIVGDLVMVEVLRGLRSDRDAQAVYGDFMKLVVVEVGGLDIARVAADHYRFLRSRGVTIRSTVDTLIATRCIAEGWPLLHRDRDYEPFVTHLGLRPALRLS